MITQVRFCHVVTLANTEHTEWSRERPGHTSLTGAIEVSPGGAGLVFTCRNGKETYEVEVPWGNIASVTRTAAPAAAPAAELRTRTQGASK